MSSQSVSSTVSVAVTTTVTSNETSGRGNFGAIGPPNRRSSLPVTVANHFGELNL